MNVYASALPLMGRANAKIPALKTAPASKLAGDISAFIDPAALFFRPFGLQKVKDAVGHDPELRLQWGFILCLPHIINLDDPESTEQRAGPYIWQIIAAFAGWKIPITGRGQLILSSSQPEPQWGQTGRAEFPILFDEQFQIVSDPT